MAMIETVSSARITVQLSLREVRNNQIAIHQMIDAHFMFNSYGICIDTTQNAHVTFDK